MDDDTEHEDEATGEIHIFKIIKGKARELARKYPYINFLPYYTTEEVQDGMVFRNRII